MPGIERDPLPEAVVHELGVSTVNIRAMFWTNSRRHESNTVTDAAIKAVKARLDADGIEIPAEIIALQATPSLRSALHGTEEITPAGNIRRTPVVDPNRDIPMTDPEQARQ